MKLKLSELVNNLISTIVLRKEKKIISIENKSMQSRLTHKNLSNQLNLRYPLKFWSQENMNF